MSQLVYVSIAIILMFLAYKTMKKVKPTTEQEKKSNKTIPDKEVLNDKIIWVKNVSQTDLENTLNNFCKMKNKDALVFIPRITPTEDNTFIITFPYDIKLGRFCEITENLLHPLDIEWEAEVLAWATVLSTDFDSELEDLVDKKVMIYVGEDYCLNMVTEENKGYFFSNYSINEAESVDKQYQKPIAVPAVEMQHAASLLENLTQC